jgi:NADPH:quinone reductase-like Zn-dependent oxidoreductase
MKAWEIVSADGIDALELNERPTPQPGPREVLVRMRANSVNYRDLSTILDPEARGLPYPRIPNSDGAGEVAATGPGVTRWKHGDRVAGCFFQDWPAGGISAGAMASALGGPIDGVLAEEAVLKEDGLVAIPDHLTFEEAACLPCAAVTAWNCLVAGGGMKAGDTVLLLGTGGVSVFALQFCVAAGARVILTSSSDAKLARAREMGARETINYVDTPDWAQRILELTGGRGTDHVLEVGGPGTMEQSIEAVRVGGHIAYVGVLTGGAIQPVGIMRKSIRLQGVYVGSRAMFEDMNRAIAAHGLKPVIDRTFAFEEARDAFRHMQAAGHFGKIVVTIP